MRFDKNKDRKRKRKISWKQNKSLRRETAISDTKLV